MEQKVLTPAMKGAALSLVLIVFSLITTFTHQTQNKAMGWVSFAILVGGVIWSCIYYAQQMNGNVTFGNVFADGFKTTAAATAITVVFTFISIKYISPEIIDLALEEARKNMEQSKNNMSSEQIDQALTFTRKFFVPFAIGGALLGSIIVGLIASLIGAAVAKKNPNPTPFEGQ